MKNILTIFIMVQVLLLSVGASAHAQWSEWKALNQEVMYHYRQGEYDLAVVAAWKADYGA